jgi:hypothetical protein
MNTRELETMLNSIVCKKRVKVLSADALYKFTKKKRPPTGFKAIVNTEPSTMGGEHWICVDVLDRNTLQIFDSLDTNQHLHNPYFKHFNSFFRKLDKNCGLLQDPFESTSCGLHCIYYFHFRCNKNMSLCDIVNKKYTDDVVTNECKVLRMISSKYKKRLYSNVVSSCYGT